MSCSVCVGVYDCVWVGSRREKLCCYVMLC